MGARFVVLSCILKIKSKCVCKCAKEVNASEKKVPVLREVVGDREQQAKDCA